MSTLQKLKAYFGMVPAEELEDYDGDDYEGRAYGRRPEYLDDDFDDYPGARRKWFGGPRAGYREDADDDFEPLDRGRPRPAWAGQTAQSDPQTHGALAMDARRDPAPRPRQLEAPAQAGGYPMGRVVTLHPSSYNEARTIGEHYRDGRPVIMNLTEMDDANAKRLVDFAAGLAFALRGSIDKVTNKVFLISPPNADPTAEDKRRLAEGGFATRS
ncbi:FIG021292: hypothetical protein [Alloactinosynnema sp. L-07]|uniref:cell division protein SepF n=1 Tax=Alloactinosynnema sp. L-07 TaxID=1653480 RepID=UPI00065EF70A|nr:cell division protein SepF [Alloactinosynnema sp. L-07]CRK58419.1 FIG021292: hypothetical protein [Alloactinosynnema sp. L-07]